MSSLLERIEERLESSSSPRVRAELLGEKACYLARGGERDAAKALVQDMRAEWGSAHIPDAMVWIMLAEGLIYYFSSSPRESWDRIVRAQHLSASLALPRLAVLTSAWMAHLEFGRSNYLEMRRHLRNVFDGDWRTHDDAALRAFLVLGDGSLNAGLNELARQSYEVAHRLAVRTGDRLALAAIMYNRAVHGFNSLMANGIVDACPPSREQLTRFALELESARHFEALIGASAFAQALDLTRGRYLLAVGEVVEASLIFRRLRLNQLPSPVAEMVSAYEVVCKVRIGDKEAARMGLEAYLSQVPSSLDVDDFLLVNSAYAEVACELGLTREAEILSAAVEKSKSIYSEIRSELITVLNDFPVCDLGCS